MGGTYSTYEIYEKYTTPLLQNLKGRDMHVDGKVVLKWTLDK
jgi:hypothetical protein